MNWLWSTFAALAFVAPAQEVTPALWGDVHLYDSRADIERRYAPTGKLRDELREPWRLSRGGLGQTVITGNIGKDCYSDVLVYFDGDGGEPGHPGEGGAYKVEIDLATELCDIKWASLAARFGQPVSDRVYQIDGTTFHESVWREGERVIHLRDDEAMLSFTVDRGAKL
jgi:hypothetical protein